jgi:hypothetical protein
MTTMTDEQPTFTRTFTIGLKPEDVESDAFDHTSNQADVLRQAINAGLTPVQGAEVTLDSVEASGRGSALSAYSLRVESMPDTAAYDVNPRRVPAGEPVAAPESIPEVVENAPAEEVPEQTPPTDVPETDAVAESPEEPENSDAPAEAPEGAVAEA